VFGMAAEGGALALAASSGARLELGAWAHGGIHAPSTAAPRRRAPARRPSR
jgi:hypothetical protein